MVSRKVVQNKIVFTPNLDGVTEVIKGIGVCWEDTDKPKRSMALADTLQKEFVEWIKDSVDLSEYPYMCVTSGITESINYFVLKNLRGSQVIGDGEYPWLDHISHGVHTAKTIDEVGTHRILYLTNPRSCDGNYYTDDEWKEILEHPCSKVLDMAYVNTTPNKRVEVNKTITEIYFSMSKSFGLGSLRMGLSFSRRPIIGASYLQRRGYFNHASTNYMLGLIRNFPPDYAYQQLKDKQQSVCDSKGFVKSDSVILGMNGDRRICLSPEYEYK